GGARVVRRKARPAGSSEPATLAAPSAPARFRTVRRVIRSMAASLPDVDRAGARGVGRMPGDAEAVLQCAEQAVVVVDAAVLAGLGERAHHGERDVAPARELLRAGR